MIREYLDNKHFDTIYWFIETKIEGKKHYFSHWEKLPDPSPVFGIVWNEYLAYGFGFGLKKDAKLMLRRIRKYDSRTKCRIVPINETLIKESKKIVAQVVGN